MDKISNFLVVKPPSSLTGEPAASGRFEEAELDEEVIHEARFGSFYELDVLHEDKVTDNWVAVLDQLESQATKQTLGESGTIGGQLNSAEASEIHPILHKDENASQVGLARANVTEKYTHLIPEQEKKYEIFRQKIQHQNQYFYGTSGEGQFSGANKRQGVGSHAQGGAGKIGYSARATESLAGVAENVHSESHGRYISATPVYIRATPVNVANSKTQPILDSTTTDVGGGAPLIGQSAGETTPQRSVTDSTLSVSTHANTSALSKQIVSIISSRDSETLIEVALDPPELGRITIEFEGRQGALNRAILSAESSVTIDLIRRNLDVLVRELSIANLGSLDLEMRDFNSDHAKRPPLHTYQHAHSDDDNLSEMSIISIPFSGSGRLDIRR